MSKKMKFRTAGALGVMMAGLISMNAYALEDKDVVGTWYVNSMSLDGENTFHPGMMKMEMTFRRHWILHRKIWKMNLDIKKHSHFRK